MNYLEVGETILADDNNEYVCYASIPYQEKMYAFLVSTKDKNIKLIAEQKNVDGELALEIVENENLQSKLKDLFLEKIGKDINN